MNTFKKIMHILMRCMLAVPLILGIIGFMQQGIRFNDALFTSISLYTMGYGDYNNGILLEIARWTAPLATASGLVIILSQIKHRLRSFILYKRGLAVAVYGTDRHADRLLEQLDSCGIEGGQKFVRAQKYILAGDESFNLAFYNRHRKKLESSSVYLRCSSLPAQASAPANLRLYCPEETAARLFWQRSEIIPLSKSNDHRMEVVIVGFGLLGEHLLTTALQQNIFHPDQRICYHIFGEENGFTATHPQLKEISDPVVFHSCPWYDERELLEQAAMVIVAEQNDQTALVEKLLLTLTRSNLQILAADTFGLNILDEQSRMTLFHWDEEAASVEQIFSLKLYEDAMQLNLAYALLYSDKPGTAEEEWAALNGFTRYSNISSADYFKVQCALLRCYEQPTVFSELSEEWIDRLAELEHIRWCRYHYLNNWCFGEPANGKAKDAVKRIHRSLIPYADLSEGEQKKDRDNIEMMFNLTK